MSHKLLIEADPVAFQGGESETGAATVRIDFSSVSLSSSELQDSRFFLQTKIHGLCFPLASLSQGGQASSSTLAGGSITGLTSLLKWSLENDLPLVRSVTKHLFFRPSRGLASGWYLWHHTWFFTCEGKKSCEFVFTSLTGYK